MSTAPRFWRPPSFAEMGSDDPVRRNQLAQDLDRAVRTIFDNLLALNNAVGLDIATATADQVISTVSGVKIIAGTSTVTGSLTGIVTGLTTVTQVVASIISTGAINEWVTPALGATAGEIELRVWQPTTDNGAAADVTPIAGTVARSVHWISWGT